MPTRTTAAPIPSLSVRFRTAVVEALRVVVLAGCGAITLGVVRGVPDVVAMHAGETASCAAPVEARPDVRWIEASDARALIDDANVVFADARSRATYEAGHVLGATNVPMVAGVVEPAELAQLRTARTVVTYCDTSGDCASSKRLAGLLAEAGLPDVRVLRGGMPTWLDAGYPAEAGPCRTCP